MLISIVGQDSAGDLLLQHWQSLQLPCNGILTKGGVSTPMTSYIFSQGKPHAHTFWYLCLTLSVYWSNGHGWPQQARSLTNE